MSSQAESYYAKRARRLGIDKIPSILNGQPVLLLGDDHEQRLSLQKPDPKTLKAVIGRYDTLIKSVNLFAIQGCQKTRGDHPVGHDMGWQQANQRHIDSVITARLFPAYLKAGYVKDIQLEALARSEVQTSHLRQAMNNTITYPYDEAREDGEVYLLLSGALVAGGKSLGYTACLTLVAADISGPNYDRPIVMARYMSAASKKNDLIAKSALQQSRTSRKIIDMWGLATQISQNTGRGQRQR